MGTEASSRNTRRRRRRPAGEGVSTGFRVLADSIPQVAWVALADGRVLWHNQRFHEYTGKTLPELSGFRWRQVHERRSLARLARRWRTRIAAGEAFDLALPLRGRDGRLRQFLARVSPIRTPQGSIMRWLGVASDVTELLETHEALHESEERYRRLFRAMSEAMAVVRVVRDGAGRAADCAYVDVNPAFECLVSLRRAELVGRKASSAQWLPVSTDQLEQAIATGAPVCFETDRPFLGRHFRVSVFCTEQDTAAVLLTDTTEVRRAQERTTVALAAAEEGRRTLDALMEHVPEGIAIADAAGHVQMVSRHGRELLRAVGHADAAAAFARWSGHEADGRTPLPADRQPLARAVSRGEVVTDVELVELGGEGGPLHLLCNAAPILGPFGDVMGGIAVWRDITGMKQIEEVLRRSEAELRDADRRKDEFLAILSHELRNPLAPIRSGLYVLEHAPAGSEPARRAQATIGRQVTQLTRLVDDLLDVTRISRNKIRLQSERLEINELVRRSVEDQRALFDEKGVRLDVALAAAAWTMGDTTRLSQVIGNLLQNAVKFTPPGGLVRVTVSVEAGCRAEVRVSDNGIGMSPEIIPRLFVPFMQADMTFDRGRGGLGLGLALVKGLVELHGGETCARSAGPGLGSEFVIRLPLQLGSARPAAGHTPAASC